MGKDQYWDEIYNVRDKLNADLISYWKEFSFLDDWQFWLVLALLVLPLVLLYVYVDRTRIFEILFFGFCVHMLWTYTDTLLGFTSLFVHQYFIVPLLPYALSMTSSVLPVGYLFVYQYATNHGKNFYLYAILVSAVFAFVFLPIEDFMGLSEFNKGMNMFYLFLIDLAIAFLSYWLTLFVKRLRKEK